MNVTAEEMNKSAELPLALILSLFIFPLLAAAALVCKLSFLEAPRVVEDQVLIQKHVTGITNRSELLLRLTKDQQRKEFALIQHIGSLIYSFNREPKESAQLAYLIFKESRNYGIDPILVTSVIASESSFKREALSHKGAIGLMQLLPATAKAQAIELGINIENLDIYDPETNIRLGIYYLLKLKKWFRGDLELALTAYNLGPTRLIRLRSSGMAIPHGPRKYARDIVNRKHNWRSDNYV